ncbi:hypothetical protein DPMN_144620 [Dreissena polymorpha]|uniref:Uncharacterized protein n=1 Tax=Dreissena polymorpha TaxID=45954 RepID=A0A9D4F2G8_DREPO|nr:hypothetical protein DPMN_144620 [Dreissena polymorpha]
MFTIGNLECISWYYAISKLLCLAIDCGRLIPGNVYTSIHCTDEYHFPSKCHFSCTNGFGVLPGHSRVRTCDANGKWVGQEPLCRDITPPQYTQCPSLLVFYADKSTDVTKVNWQNPVHSDNAGLGSTSARLVQGPSPGSVVRVGEYMVVYQAWDSENNTASWRLS